MASAGAIRAARAFVELFVEDSKMVKGLRAAQAKLKAFGASVQSLGKHVLALGAGITAPLTAAVVHFANAGDALDKMSARTGATVESLSTLGFAADRSGASMETLEGGIASMQTSLLAAERGQKKAIRNFDDLGLSIAELSGLSPEEQFKRIAQAISEVEDPSRRAALATKVLGGAGADLLPMMMEGAKGIEMLQEKARRLGLEVSTKDSKSAAELADAWGDVKAQFFAVAMQAGAALAPMLTELLQNLTPLLKGAIDWVKNNKQLVVTIAKVGAALVIAGGAILAIGVAASAIGTAIGGLATGFTAFAAVAKAVIAVITFVGPILLSMITPANIALAALAAFFLFGTEAGGRFRESIASTFADVKAIFAKTLGGIFDALMGGDFSLAGDIAMTGLKLAWERGTRDLRKVWIDFRTFLVDTFFVAMSAIERGWVQLVANLKGLFLTVSEMTVGATIAFRQATGQMDSQTAGVLGAFNKVGHDQARAKVQSDTAAELDKLANRRNDLITTSGEDADRERKEIDDRISALSTSLDELTKAAAAAKEKFWADISIDDAAKKKGGAAGPLDSVAASAGTFNPFAIRGFASGPFAPLKKIEEHAKDTAKHTKKIADKPALAWGT